MQTKPHWASQQYSCSSCRNRTTTVEVDIHITTRSWSGQTHNRLRPCQFYGSWALRAQSLWLSNEDHAYATFVQIITQRRNQELLTFDAIVSVWLYCPVLSPEPWIADWFRISLVFIFFNTNFIFRVNCFFLRLKNNNWKLMCMIH